MQVNYVILNCEIKLDLTCKIGLFLREGYNWNGFSQTRNMRATNECKLIVAHNCEGNASML